MIYTGARSSFAVAKSGGTDYVKIPFSTEGLKLAVNYVDSEALVGKRGIYAYGQTNIGVDGDVSFEAFPQSLTWGLYASLGKSLLTYTRTSGGTINGYVYTITPIGVSESLPTYDVYVNNTGAEAYTYKYTGVKAGQLALNLTNNAVPKVTLTLAGIDRENGSKITPNVHADDNKPFFVKQITIKSINGTTVTTLPDLTSLDLTINNNFDTDTTVLDGTGKRKDIIEQKLDITGTINALYTSDSTGSADTFKSLYKSGDTIGIEVVISNGDKSVDITIPHVYIKEYSDNVGGAGKIPLNISFTAIEPSDGSDMITAVCKLTAASDLI